MLLSKAIALVGIAALSTYALESNIGSTLSTKFIERSPGSETTYSTSWRVKDAPATTDPSDGWTVVSESEPTSTDDGGWEIVSESEPTPIESHETTTVNDTNPQATYVRPNNAMVAHRMAMIAGVEWGRFPTKADNETEACINSTTIDNGTEHIRYDNSTVNCTALMFGDRWHRWECDRACRTALGASVPATILSAVGSELANSDGVQRAIRAVRELLSRRVSFLRLGRFFGFLRRDPEFLGEIFEEQSALATEYFDGLAFILRGETENVAYSLRIDFTALERVQDTLNELMVTLTASFLDSEFDENGRRRLLAPETFDTLQEYEDYILELLERREWIRQLRANSAEPDPLLEQIFRQEPDIPENLAQELHDRIAVPPYSADDPNLQPPEYEDPPAYESRRYRAEQDLYDSVAWLTETPPNNWEIERFGRYNSWPTPVPVPNPTIPVTTIPATPSVQPTVEPSEVPILPPDTPESSEVDLALDGALTISGSGAWAIAADISLRLLGRLETCAPLANWVFIPRSSSFLAHATLAAWNGIGVADCFAREIAGVGGPPAQNVVTQGFKEYEMKVELEINPKKPPIEEPGKGPPSDGGPPKEGGPPDEGGAPKEQKKLKKCKWWQILLRLDLWGVCCL